MNAVYPRVCGGTLYLRSFHLHRAGLSPRVRGNRPRLLQALRCEGSIPACAGEPALQPVVLGGGKVYPRVCGGTSSSSGMTCQGAGLSPRVRGNPQRKIYIVPQPGSIPACAGEPPRLRPRPSPVTVYPRVCGGTRCRCGRQSVHWGLSPRVRGNHRDAQPHRSQVRSIPACAGEPLGIAQHIHCQQVYPRVCGGTICSGFDSGGNGGLSPRVRGNLSGRQSCHFPRRSIPACAGEPATVHADDFPVEVYPRVCGGTSPRKGAAGIVHGLSPRVRGNLANAGWVNAKERSIPACAGEPNASARGNAACRVYPRVCGGTGAGQPQRGRIGGLSPRVRGNPADADLLAVQKGSIPACAGEPCPCP